MMNLAMDQDNFLKDNIAAYITAYHNIQECKDHGKEPGVKILPPYGNSDKCPQFKNIVWNWMIPQ